MKCLEVHLSSMNKVHSDLHLELLLAKQLNRDKVYIYHHIYLAQYDAK